jgi:thiol-disulfide isomerase/thioredoxin
VKLFGRNARHACVAIAGCLAVVLVTAGCSTSDDSLTGSKGYITGEGVVTTVEPEDRTELPRLQGEQLGGGKVDTDDYAGQITVLNTWASWCSPCRAEVDDLTQTAEQFPDVAFVGLNVRDSKSGAEAFVRNKDVPFPSLVSEDGSVLLEFYGLLNVNSLPSTIVVDADGKIAALVLGEVTAGTLSGLIEDVQKEA